jgi:Ca2+-binding EF-hand superfamily protein/endogenous inhibitor of DNA gyrase (YacG/DUF329 family)
MYFAEAQLEYEHRNYDSAYSSYVNCMNSIVSQLNTLNTTTVQQSPYDKLFYYLDTCSKQCRDIIENQWLSTTTTTTISQQHYQQQQQQQQYDSFTPTSPYPMDNAYGMFISTPVANPQIQFPAYSTNSYQTSTDSQYNGLYPTMQQPQYQQQQPQQQQIQQQNVPIAPYQQGKYHQMTSQEQSVWTNNFSYISSNGECEFAKFKTGLQYIGYGYDDQPENTLANAIFNGYNIVKDTRITVDEFVATSMLLLYGNADERLEFAMRCFDPNYTGIITRDQFRRVVTAAYTVIESMNIEYDIDKSSFINELFDKCDVDNDNVISRNDLIFIIQDKYHPLRTLGLIQSTKTKYPIKRIGVPVAVGNQSLHKVLTMMIGIRIAQMDHTAIRTSFREKEYSYICSYRLPSCNSSSYEFKCYAPSVFRHIRSISGVTEDEFAMELSPEQLIGNLLLGTLTTLAESLSEGKSGSFFFCSHSGFFLCKTIAKEELQTFQKFLKTYHNHLITNPNTLLSKIYGLYSINNTAFIVMANSFDTQLSIDRIYDLKGSTVNRSNTSGTGVMKDLDWKRDKMLLNIGGYRATQFMDQLERDVEILRNTEIMDYSLIVAVHHCQPNEVIQRETNVPFFREDGGGMRSTDGRYIFVVAVIDILVEYGVKKMVEHGMKKLILLQGEGTSVSEPKPYATRYLNYIRSILQ